MLEKQLVEKGTYTKMNFEADMNDELRPEYTAVDLKNRVRGKYAHRLGVRTQMVALDPDIAEAYPSAVAVNTALRQLLQSQNKTTAEHA